MKTNLALKNDNQFSALVADMDGHRGSHTPLGTQHPYASPDPDLIAMIREQWRRRQSWHKAEKALTLQAKSLCRRLCLVDMGLIGVELDAKQKTKVITATERLFRAATTDSTDHTMAETAYAAMFPLLQARDVLEDKRKQVEKELERMAKQLPVYDFVQQVKGAGALTLAGIVGEAGDVGSYKTVSAFWKRMGLAVIGDGRQRKVSGVDALDHGYSPRRRSLVWNLGECLTKAQIRKDPEDEEKRVALGYYGQVYLERRAYEAERVSTLAHGHNRAKRYMEKRFLRHLYSAWRGGHGSCETQSRRASPQNTA